MKKLGVFVCTVALVLSVVGLANAVPITFSFEGIASGSFNNQTFFSSTEITFELYGDTDDVYEGGGIFWLETTGSLIDIAGMTPTSFADNKRMFMNSNNNGLGFQDDIHYDLLDIQDDALAGYDLRSAIGPIFEDSPFAVYQFTHVSTGLGAMTLTDVEWVNFEATTTAPVPEPATMLLLGSGLLGIVALGRKKLSN